MGNILTFCYPSETTVKVYHGDTGELLEFPRAIPAVNLMRRYPYHLLVYSIVQVRQPTSRTGGTGQGPQQCVHIRVVRTGALLKIGQVYFLVPIPDQYRNRLAKYFDLDGTSAGPSKLRYNSRSSNPLHSPTASPLYSPTTSPLYSPTASPLYTPTGSPHPSMGSPRSFWTSTASPLGPVALPRPMSKPGPLISTSPGERMRVACPRSSYSPSPLSGITRERTRMDFPRSTHIQNSFSSSNQEMRRIASHQYSRQNSNKIQSHGGLDAAARQQYSRPNSNKTQSPGGLDSTARQQYLRLNSNKIQSPGGLDATASQQYSRQNSNRIQNPGGLDATGKQVAFGGIISLTEEQIPRRLRGSMRSPGRVTTPAKEDPLMSFLHPSLQLQQNPPTQRTMQTPGRATMPAEEEPLMSYLNPTLQLQQIPPSKRTMESPGRAVRPTRQDTRTNIPHQDRSGRSPRRVPPLLRIRWNVNQRPQDSSPHCTRKSPRRTGKLGSGKANHRLRRTRSPHHKPPGSLMKSPESTTNEHTAIASEADSVPCRPMFDAREWTTRSGGNNAGRALEPPLDRGNTFSLGNSREPRLTRSRAVRHGHNWGPGLGSISETSASDTSDVDELIMNRYYSVTRRLPPSGCHCKR